MNQPPTPPRILVTGGAGFLGSHLCARLIEAGHEVVCVDNYFTGSKRNIEALLGHPRFETIRHDVTQPLVIEADCGRLPDYTVQLGKRDEAIVVRMIEESAGRGK